MNYWQQTRRILLLHLELNNHSQSLSVSSPSLLSHLSVTLCSCLQGLQASSGGVPACRGHGSDSGGLRRRPGGPHSTAGSHCHHCQERVSGCDIVFVSNWCEMRPFQSQTFTVFLFLRRPFKAVNSSLSLLAARVCWGKHLAIRVNYNKS